MRKPRLKTIAAGVVIGAIGLMSGCAEQIGDIDRTGENKILKSDLLDHEWHMRVIVSDVSPTAEYIFNGAYLLGLERVRFWANPTALHVHRSYDQVPGSDDRVERLPDGTVVESELYDEFMGDDGTYYGARIFGFDINSHFDVQRQYNPQTGEQTNVIVENTTDRDWHERDFMRVNWSTGSPWESSAMSYRWYVGEEFDSEDRVRMEYDDEGEIEYFEFTQYVFMQPSFWQCYSWTLADCEEQRVELRYSFSRVPEESDYEAVTYDDVAMNKFGYFRTERTSWDRRRGTTQESQIQLANRHNIWSDTWRRDDNGEILRDESGRPVARPFAERTLEPVVYHVNDAFPENLIDPYLHNTAEGWDRAFRRAAAAAIHDGDDTQWESIQPMFIVCDNPVTDTPLYPADPSLAHYCGEEGTHVRNGDVRYSLIYWVNNPQVSGPLGYGPSAADPITGEIVSGTAYVYGASIDTYAQFALDVIRFANGDLDDEDLQNPNYIRNQIRESLDGTVDPRAHAFPPEVANADIREDIASLMEGHSLDTVLDLRADLADDGRIQSLRSNPGFDTRRHQRLAETGLDAMLMDDEWVSAFRTDPQARLSDDQWQAMLPTTVFQEMEHTHDTHPLGLSEHDCVFATDALDDSILGIAQHYAGREDYDTIYNEIRGMIFQAVMEHEIGHTVGLRHNFAGSWDSINYFDGYWDARVNSMMRVDENGNMVEGDLRVPDSLAELWSVAYVTDELNEARTREIQYSSIMDYSSAFNTDFGGIGRYDEAAVIFGYTTGADSTTGDPSARNYNDQELGYVEVFNDLPAEGVDLLRTYEGRTVGQYNMLEEYHYTTVVSTLGGGDMRAGVDNLRDRSLRRYDDVLDDRFDDAADRPMEVPYLFCSDEYNGSRQFCRVWDRGADPMEQTLDYIQRYRRYYYFDNYRRDRLGWSSFSVLNRYYARNFINLVDTYQRWLLNVAIRNSPDDVLANQWTFAAYAGLNLLAEVLTTPSYGSYIEETETVYDENGDDIGERTVMNLATLDEDNTLDLVVPEGQGRYRYSRYDADEGYYYFYYPLSAGHFYTYLGAILAITSTSANVLGVDVQQGDVQYSIPPYLVFGEEMTTLFNGLFLDDRQTIGPVVDGTDLHMRPMTTIGLSNGQELNPENGAIVDPAHRMGEPAGDNDLVAMDMYLGFSDRLYAGLYGMLSFTSNYSLAYPDQARVFRMGTDEEITPGPGYEVVQFCDETTASGGQCYGALHETGSDATLAVQLVRDAATLQARVEDGTAQSFELDNILENINLMRAFYEYFGTAF